MNPNNHDRNGLLTNREREILAGEAAGSDDQRSEIVRRLRERLPTTLTDIEILYLYLDDDEFGELFDKDEEIRERMRSLAQYAFAFLYYGLQLNGDDIEYRLSSAIKQAEAAHERNAIVTLNIVTEPFLPPEQRLEALKQDGFNRVSIGAFEHLFYDERVSPESLAEALSISGIEETTPEDLKTEREAAEALLRPPTAVVTNVQIESNEAFTSKNERFESGGQDDP